MKNTKNICQILNQEKWLINYMTENATKINKFKLFCERIFRKLFHAKGGNTITIGASVDKIITSPHNDPFLQRVIEHWLDSVNELGYQVLFCEWLLFQGYAVKYEIRNPNFEQGKDVVAVDSAGIPHAYQLKGGNISLHRWRTEVKPEIEVLIGAPIIHPGVDSSKGHVSYLVTNGNIDDSVRVEIDSLNRGIWKEKPLKIFLRGDLLQGFQKIATEVLPQDAQAYRTLTNLIFVDGTSFVDLKEIYPFLCQILHINDQKRSMEQRKRDISAAILYTTMIIGPYREKDNYVSMIRVMVLLLSLILYLTDRYNLQEKYWLKSYNLVWGDILDTAKKLESEVESKGFTAPLIDPFDKIDLPFCPGVNLMLFRKHVTASMIFSFKMSQIISGDFDVEDVLQNAVFDKYKNISLTWGEASFLPVMFLALMCVSTEKNKENGITLMEFIVNEILKHNGRNAENSIGLLPPFFDLNFLADKISGNLEEPLDHQGKHHSYYIKPVLEIMTRLDQKDFISKQWREISFMFFEEFIFDQKFDYYLMRSKKGENRTIVPKKEKSWKELVGESNSFNGSTLPDSIKRFPEFIPFFLCVFPHRLNSDVLGFLFQKLQEK